MSTDEWLTPPELVEEIDGFLENGIELDPTSNEVAQQEIVHADTYWTKEDDCLSKDEWCGSVFMNPPYTRSAGTAGPYVKKLVEQWGEGNVVDAMVLLNNATGNNWWQPLWGFPMCFMSSRLKYLDLDMNRNENPMYDNVLVYLPKEGEDYLQYRAFKEAFEEWGECIHSIDRFKSRSYVSG